MDGYRTAAGPPAKGSPARNRIGLTNIQMRTVTICIVGPAVLAFSGYSGRCAALLAFFATFMCGIEWSGVKRHLKVALLMSMENTAMPAPQSPMLPLTMLADLVARPPPPSPCIEGVPLCPEEYDLPVAPISLYNVLKHLGWALLPLAAYSGEQTFLVTLEFYFVVFVVVTLTAHNRLELKVEQAMKLLSQQLSSGSQDSSRGAASAVCNGGGAPTAAAACKTEPDLSRTDQSVAKKERVAKAQRDYFLSMELHMIAERQPTEQFLDFCLDIFGIVWIAGIATPLFVYHITDVGLPWLSSTLIGNFANDIAALVVGRSLTMLRERYGKIYDVTGEEPPATGAANQPRKRPLKEANGLVRMLLRSPHHLNRAISPNKSVEGAVAGVIMNAVSFAGLMFWFYRELCAAPAANVVDPAFQNVALWLLLGTIMGVLGVCGDLLESLLKRAARVKDAGFIIPGHGGILDRVDGMLLVFPFMHCALRGIMSLSSNSGNRR
ncbi:phosphatidate cytidylyltransferase-like protein [Leishmania donovani]|uniref:Phosphatidate cytidylyltransferase n=3 Tax=Leishmania donovani species complex TaxID=38574 RepID=A0A6L0XLZ0_LEIIN|nr:phosphatidate cytidylyltransferase-like protein [Leishmania infantum JPCM5]AYU81852.1 phosphatidate cytidylyltransferase-like protein [Leishmania donovani]CAC9527056.1 phosphatidate_cytidylyltransferase-like_protein [Leishmania infantum]TPP47306.1 Cytidylyltransferase family protein [Leishmania donovani]CAJ1991837.1 phosphatidate cytidylyltransferase-like protein [Leishmania donovani]CBZ08919.1 phosphatidate cytidylyltransferase-like protein [Leishmania infantum JPCM5]|eukprot:XP_003392723.1 phosphatidate cytidylyltransferase-like protein [Leishmania infantum JPCM5]